MDKRIAKIYKPGIIKFGLNLWPPFWGAGIKILHISEDFRLVKVRLKLSWWNKNANRTQYGEVFFSYRSIYSMMLIGILREEYYVWDKEASINFIKPGHSDLYADFEISEGMIEDIFEKTRNGDKWFPEFTIYIKDKDGNVVSEVKRKLYVRKKPQYREEEVVTESS